MSQKIGSFDIFDIFEVILQNFLNNKLHMSLLKSLLDTESLLNVYTVLIHEKLESFTKKM